MAKIGKNGNSWCLQRFQPNSRGLLGVKQKSLIHDSTLSQRNLDVHQV